ncbi:phospholipase D-like domain-containing protein [Sphingomonas abietis]|uniref:Phospholipase D n=1 Tax=Sphingomonas abietis TaxID=3012344 RepID=A0ABY7NLY8_9SPHN|nr:phosphatidylserine/phosphatidylglycerophosphate/cardiolipin synthase family protein [Sphingomonas abietis]WBO22539.1 phosphatidylserine/phosphatidylglycerophosphate/cardiolipin synthase family protein [Sphingomonas abietis]
MAILDADSRDRFEVDGNRLHLLIDPDARLEALIALIDGAEHHLRLLYYIFWDDPVGIRVRDALMAACARGVTVSLLVDGFGSERASDGFFAPLREAGAAVCRFLPRFGRRYLLRNHQKLALADQGRALVGGFNVAQGYFGTGEEDWRDLGLLVEGPAAAHLHGYFDHIQAWAQDPKARIRTLNRCLIRKSQKSGQLRWLFGGPTQRLSPWARALKADIGRSRRLDVIAAYFAPNPGMLRRIGRLARRGTLRIISAAKSDNTMTISAARHCYVRLLRRGGRIWEYQPQKLHTKLFVADDVSYIGSANFDMRSLYINCEIMLRIDHAPLAERLRGYFEQEVEASREASLALIRERAGWWMRTKWRLAYFVVAVVDYTVTRRLNFRTPGADIG